MGPDGEVRKSVGYLVIKEKNEIHSIINIINSVINFTISH